MNSGVAFKVNWDNLKKQFIQKFSLSDSVPPVFTFYFESADSLFCFLSASGSVLYAEVPLAQIKNVRSFKMEYLQNSMELVENPLKTKWVISEGA